MELELKLWELQDELDIPNKIQVVGVQHLQLDEAFCVAFSSGDILLCSLGANTVCAITDWEKGV